MSKAFDTVNRNTLPDDLQEALDEDELYLLSILTNRPQIQVKIGKQCGDMFETLVGVGQGNVLSAILFIFYFANCLRLPIKTKMKGTIISLKYADDITYGSTNGNQIDELEKKVPVRLNTYANDDKTEKISNPKTSPSTATKTIHEDAPETQRRQAAMVRARLDDIQTLHQRQNAGLD